MRLKRIIRNRYVLAPLILLVVSGLVAGVLTGAFTSAARRSLYATGLLSHGGASTLPPGAFADPAVPNTAQPQPQPSSPSPQGDPPPVLRAAVPGPPPSAQRVAAKVKGVVRKGKLGTYSGAVLDEGTGKVLFANNATKGYLPASTLKLLTTTAAISIMGPEHQFATRTVSAGRGQLTLVGGGDPYLLKSPLASDPGRASLSRLAELTAAGLKRQHVSKVTLRYDVSLFSGPAWNPDWPPGYRDQVTPITALWVNEGRVGGAVGARVPHPAKNAANDFAAALRVRGVAVSSVSAGVAPKGSAPVASVKSMPLDRIVEHLLMVSDNDAAEVVARQAAIASGQPGSFVAARKVVRARLVKLGVWDPTARLRDGSGLSRSNKVPADLMARVLRLDLEVEHPELRPVITALPVAGVEGSLRNRFGEEGARAGRGLIRAKTGTLTEVSALAGFVRTADGSMMTYAFLVNGAEDYFGTRAWLDRVLSALSTCGCR